MKKAHLIAAIAVAITSLSFPASARTVEDMFAEVAQMGSQAVAAYKNGGMQGLERLSQRCYQNIRANQFKCVYLDMAARYIDRLGGGGSKFPLAPYFDDEAFAPRAFDLFSSKGMTLQQGNEYFATMQPVINTAVEQAFSQNDQPRGEACVKQKYAVWEKKRDAEITRWCRDLERKGEECRLSAGVDEQVRAEALEEIKVSCR